MDLVSLKYMGGRESTKVIWNRIKYIFNKENDFTCDIPQKLVGWLARYAPGKYQVVSKIIIKEVIKEIKPNLKCDECDFVAKSETGLIVHKGKHKRGVK